MVAKKLRLYLQAHTIVVLTKQPLRLILMKLDISKRMVHWSLKLSEFDLKYMPRTTIKVQAVTDFIVKQNEEEHKLVQ